MLKKIKPKNARSKRELQKREPKIEENVKKAIFIRSSSTSQIVNEALSDLCKLKKPDAINFTKKNNIHPFDDETSLNFFCEKNDTSLFVVGSHTKKRPNNLTFIRMFDGQILDMIEVGIENAKSLNDFKTSKCAIGMKPLFLFNGDLFENSHVHKTFKNILLDFYRGQSVKHINLSGLEHIISVTAINSTLEQSNDPKAMPGLIYFKVYSIKLKKSGEKTPRVELEEMGPSYVFRIRRFKFANDDVYKLATKVPKINKPKKIKNIDVNEMGDKIGRIHLGKQDLGKLQTRKMKGLKRVAEDYEEEYIEEIPTSKKQKV
ncbi:20718_t:CDS:2 [Funneliformis geosporum]|uniref:Ribosome production factor 2 homolog n=1 Tax=Funneliformis geosporum TaxID=1117311 RepID=A0A9W4WVI5_9GLOM|nr:20718_t:CDS:2 [Funneliformis geosporum]CAI2175243.1 17150_t:CDS:2 [Funneliformis geosporum]